MQHNSSCIATAEFGPDVVGVSVAATSQAFDTAGRLIPTRTPEEFLQALRKNPSLRIESVEPATLGTRTGINVRFKTAPKPPFPEFCRGTPCVLLFPQKRGTFVLLPGTEEFTIVKQGRGVFIVDSTFGDRSDPRIARQIERLLDSIRFEN